MDAAQLVLRDLLRVKPDHILLNDVSARLDELKEAIETNGLALGTLASMRDKLVVQLELLELDNDHIDWEEGNKENLRVLRLLLTAEPSTWSTQFARPFDLPVSYSGEAHRLRHHLTSPTENLPGEFLGLVLELNQIYMLHTLATSPETILPPGKSILSMMTHHHHNLHEDAAPLSLEKRVEKLVHKAFWDEALETLSVPTPSKQLARLKLLYTDLFEQVAHLFPSGSPILKTFTSPLSPTSAPLLLATRDLRELLVALKTRCASVRDVNILELISALDTISASLPTPDVAHIVVDTVKAIFNLAADMKSDIVRFVAGNLSEAELSAEITSQAQEKERRAITKIWGSDVLQQKWTKWVNEVTNDPRGDETRIAWIRRLIQALGVNAPVSCLLSFEELDHGPPTGAAHGSNNLPPQFLFVSRELELAQNVLQALVITATLRCVIPRHHHTTTTAPPVEADITEMSFTERVWRLLHIEVHESQETRWGGATTLSNLEDEVIREYRSLRARSDLPGDDAAEEQRLREAVARTLRPRDPVFVLLQHRLLESFAPRVEAYIRATVAPQSVPETMQTGHERERKRVRLNPVLRVNGGASAEQKHYPQGLVVKGFEDPVLVKGVSEVTRDITRSVEWIRKVWGLDVSSHT